MHCLSTNLDLWLLDPVLSTIEKSKDFGLLKLPSFWKFRHQQNSYLTLPQIGTLSFWRPDHFLDPYPKYINRGPYTVTLNFRWVPLNPNKYTQGRFTQDA